MKRYGRGNVAVTAGIAIATATLLAACSSSSSNATADAKSSDTPQYGGTLTIGVSEETVCLDPQQDNYNPFRIDRQIVDSLTDQSATDPSKIVPWLATSWSITNDAKTYTFHLRSGVTFSNGTALTASVVKDNFETLAKIPGAAGAPLVSGITSITVQNPLTLTINFAQPNAAFLEATSTTRLGIEAEASVNETPDQKCNDGVIGSGPFVLQSRILNQTTVLVARKGYNWAPADALHTGKAYLSKIVYEVIPETTNQIGAIESHQVELINSVATQDAASLKAAGIDIISGYQPGETVPLVINTSKAPLNDEAVRLAIRNGINRQALSETVFDGYDPPATGILTPPTSDYLDLSSDLTYDPTEAEKELQDDGWVPGPNGVREKDGKPLDITVSYIAGGSNQTFLEVIQQQLATIGIHLQLNPVTEGQLDQDELDGDYELMRWSNTLNDPDVLRITYATDENDRLHLPAGNALDPLLAEEAETSNPTQRKAIVDKAQKLIVGNAWAIPVFDSVELWAATPNVHDVEFTGSGTDLELYDTWLSS